MMNSIKKHKKTLIIPDPGFYEKTGHHYEFNKSIYDSAIKNGIDIEIFGHSQLNISDIEYNVKKVFTKSYYSKPLKTITSKILYPYNYLLSNFLYYKDLTYTIKKRDLSNYVIFAHTIDHNQLLGLIMFTLIIPVHKRPQSIFCLWRFSYERFANHPIYKYSKYIIISLFKFMDLCFPERDIFTIASETEQLKSNFENYTKHPVIILPIPHSRQNPGKKKKIFSEHFKFDTSNHLIFSYLGSARKEKGYQYLFGTINNLQTFCTQNRILFWLQSNLTFIDDISTSVNSTITDFKKSNFPFVHLYEKVLSSDNYNSCLYQSDVIILPYQKGDYTSRGSGIFMEAMSSGKFVIVPKDTWMAHNITEGINGITFESGNTSSLSHAIKTTYKIYKKTDLRRQHISKIWSDYHNADSLIKLLKL